MTDSPYSGRDAAVYMAAVDALVGKQEPLDILSQASAKLADFFIDKPEDKLAVPEANGKWSMRQVVDHLFDVELVYAYRIRMILASDKPRFLTMDQDDWVNQQWYRSLGLQSMLESLGAFRDVNVAMLSGLPAEQRKRYGVHSQRGNETVDDLMRRWAGHDLLHLLQLDRIWKAVSRTRG